MARKKLINKKVLMSLFIVAIMVLSAFGFMMSYQTNQRDKLADYNGFKFSRTQNGLVTKINNQELAFNYYPEDLEQINMSDDAKLLLSGTKVLFVTYDPNSDFASSIAEQQLDMEQKFIKVGDRFLTKGFTNATGYALPQITCANATAAMPVYQIEQSNETKVEVSDNCVILTVASETELNAYHAKVLYLLLGVMN
ncbi:hypothetical protein KY333_00475 [Candidatus Woesearchaeota archaeon]|nr:hypothetical protein [Candidatus Woesearchaeota archaeon]MBW2994217.1 hypothetical protein [Candidatus Woesearchaeota archaeon]